MAIRQFDEFDARFMSIKLMVHWYSGTHGLNAVILIPVQFHKKNESFGSTHGKSHMTHIETGSSCRDMRNRLEKVECR